MSSRLTEIPHVRGWAAARVRSAGYGDQDVLALEIALAEALSNVVRHAYRGEDGHDVVVTVDAAADAVRVTIVDHGEPADPSTWARHDSDEPRDGGYGLQLIDDVMDEVTRTRLDGGTALTLVKYRSPKGDS